MKITKDNLKAWFPQDRRFLHYCAKFYSLSFHSKDVVEEANFIAIKNVMALYNREQEFESERHMIGTVMSSFRFAILNAYKSMEGRNRKYLQVRSEASLIYNGIGSGDHNLYEAACVSYDKPYDIVHERLNEFIDTQLPIIEREVIRRYVMDGEDAKVIAEDLDITIKNIHSAKTRAFRKLRKFKERLDDTVDTKPKPVNDKRYISAAISQLRIQMAIESVAKQPIKVSSYSEAMSFLYPKEEA